RLGAAARDRGALEAPPRPRAEAPAAAARSPPPRQGEGAAARPAGAEAAEGRARRVAAAHGVHGRPLVAARERRSRGGAREGTGGPEDGPAAGRRARVVALREPPSRLLRC